MGHKTLEEIVCDYVDEMEWREYIPPNLKIEITGAMMEIARIAREYSEENIEEEDIPAWYNNEV